MLLGPHRERPAVVKRNYFETYTPTTAEPQAKLATLDRNVAESAASAAPVATPAAPTVEQKVDGSFSQPLPSTRNSVISKAPLASPTVTNRSCRSRGSRGGTGSRSPIGAGSERYVRGHSNPQNLHVSWRRWAS